MANSTFLNFLLTTDFKQQKVIMNNLTDSQSDALSEVFFNILNNIQLSPDDFKFMKRKIKVLKELSKVNRSRNYRKRMFKKYKVPAIAILDQTRTSILQLLDSFAQE